LGTWICLILWLARLRCISESLPTVGLSPENLRSHLVHPAEDNQTQRWRPPSLMRATATGQPDDDAGGAWRGSQGAGRNVHPSYCLRVKVVVADGGLRKSDKADSRDRIGV
jgi:hypothetical protein